MDVKVLTPIADVALFRSDASLLPNQRSAVLDVTRDLAIDKARSFLLANAGNLLSFTNTSEIIHENFAQLLIQELTGDP